MLRKKRIIIALSVAALVLLWLPAAQAGATRVSEAIWAHGELYDTVVTPTSFVAPPEHSTDTIYSFMMSGLGGQRSVADSAPGDRDFNGGRWDVQIVVFTDLGKAVHDEDGDGMVDFELTAADEVMEHYNLGHIEIFPANFYFECPMLPRHR